MIAVTKSDTLMCSLWGPPLNSKFGFTDMTLHTAWRIWQQKMAMTGRLTSTSLLHASRWLRKNTWSLALQSRWYWAYAYDLDRYSTHYVSIARLENSLKNSFPRRTMTFTALWDSPTPCWSWRSDPCSWCRDVVEVPGCLQKRVDASDRVIFLALRLEHCLLTSTSRILLQQLGSSPGANWGVLKGNGWLQAMVASAKTAKHARGGVAIIFRTRLCPEEIKCVWMHCDDNFHSNIGAEKLGLLIMHRKRQSWVSTQCRWTGRNFPDIRVGSRHYTEWQLYCYPRCIVFSHAWEKR